MATSAERMRAHRERAHHRLRRLTADVSEDDLRTLAERGHEGAASSDHGQQAHPVGLFPRHGFCKSDRLNSCYAVAGGGVASRDGVT